MAEQFIPKIIHYAWFGRGQMPELAINCIDSWKRFLPDYKYIEWNEDNFDLNMYPYAMQAYKDRKFAFVTDVVRLFALYNYGGIYMDTDVEVLKPFGSLLENHGFSGFENKKEIPTGIIASEKGNGWVKDQLEYYKNASFKTYETNVKIITRTSLDKHNLVQDGKYQVLKYGMVMYPAEYFCPKSLSSGEIKVTENTYTIHHFGGSWLPKKLKLKYKLYSIGQKVFGRRTSSFIHNAIKKVIMKNEY